MVEIQDRGEGSQRGEPWAVGGSRYVPKLHSARPLRIEISRWSGMQRLRN
jgi:hypothetical protein